MRTGPVKALVREVLATLPQPYSEHVIDDVFFSIETRPEWLRVYESLCTTLGKTVVNNWIGYWVANALAKVGEQVLPSKKSKLIASYSLLDTDAKSVVRKPKEDEALQLMSDYYKAHKSELPPDIRQYREGIVELLMEGMPAAAAFSAVRKGKT
jgi:hypothetical protein